MSTFAAFSELDGTARSVSWEEHEDGSVQALEYTEFHQDGEGFIAPGLSDYLWGLAAQHGYVGITADLEERVGWFGAPFPNVTALLTAVGMPPDATREPMRRGCISLSP